MIFIKNMLHWTHYEKGQDFELERDEIIIRNAVVHILDSTVGVPVLSDVLLELSPDLNDFLRGHIYKIASGDDCKKCCFNMEESMVYQSISGFLEENMVKISQEICKHLYTIMNENIDIPPADVMVATFQAESIMHLAILKMNYKDSYIHLTGTDGENSNYNDIIKQTATLPSAGSRLSEAVLINLSDYSILLAEKKYDVNGVKTNYMSELFLQCQTRMSSKTKLGIVTKAMDQIHKKYFEEDFGKKMEAKSIIQDEIAEQGVLNVEVIGEKIYGSIPEIKEEFTEKLEKYNLQKEEVRPQNKQTIRKYEKQFLVTDTGIEINIPMEEYKDGNKVEFITNPDGTISVLIKNISHITSR